MEKDPAPLEVSAEDNGLVLLEVIGYGQVEMTWIGAVELLHMLYAASQVAAQNVGADFSTWERVHQEAVITAQQGIRRDE